MKKEDIILALKKARERSKKRNFKQSCDIIFNLKDLDLKKTEHKQDFFVALHFSRGKKVKICALVGPELKQQAEQNCDETILLDNFDKYANKKEAKKLADKYDFFIAQATIMPKVAATFGSVFGPRGKIPNPKAGCVVPPNANLKPLIERLQKSARIQTKNEPIIQTSVGMEDMKDEEITDNILAIYDALIHHLPNAEYNIRNAYLKLTMGKAIMIGAKEEETKEEKIKK